MNELLTRCVVLEILVWWSGVAECQEFLTGDVATLDWLG